MPIAAAATDGFTIPAPIPMKMPPASRTVQSEPTSTPRLSNSPTPAKASPVAIRKRTGTRSVSRPAIAAAKKEAIVSGKRRKPVSSAS